MGSAASKGGGGEGGARAGPTGGHTALSNPTRSGGRRGLVHEYGGRRPRRRANVTEPQDDKVTPTSEATTAANPASGDIYHPPKVCIIHNILFFEEQQKYMRSF